jgi:hypothetical protein
MQRKGIFRRMYYVNYQTLPKGASKQGESAYSKTGYGCLGKCYSFK